MSGFIQSLKSLSIIGVSSESEISQGIGFVMKYSEVGLIKLPARLFKSTIPFLNCIQETGASRGALSLPYIRKSMRTSFFNFAFSKSNPLLTFRETMFKMSTSSDFLQAASDGSQSHHKPARS